MNGINIAEKSMTTEEILWLARDVGFDHTAELNMAALDFRPEVREMCASGRCHAYGTRWSCPPAVGDLVQIRRRTEKYRRGVVVQTTGQMAHDFDAKGIFDVERRQKERFETLVRQIRYSYPGCLPMGTGACTICRKCTYPSRPCRYPERMFISMEAYGLMVNDVASKSGLEYDYGPLTITYTALILID